MSQTPLLEQYAKIKQRYRDTILLFQVGDFYEMFYDDAKIASKVLGLTLTARSYGKHNKVPLAGIPLKTLDTYLGRLVNAGFKVAICEQLAGPGLTKLIKRNVIEVITPGTTLRPTLLEVDKNHYLLAIRPPESSTEKSEFGIAFADISTGEFYLTHIQGRNLLEEIQKIDPKEILLPKSDDPPPFKTSLISSLSPHYLITPLDDYYFSFEFAYEKLKSHFAVANLAGFGIEEYRQGIQAAGAVLYYLEQALAAEKNSLAHIQKLSLYRTTDYLLLDRMTRKNLELTERLSDGTQTGTLLSVLSRTTTPLGARLLRKWLLSPLLDIEKIRARQQAVEEFCSNPFLLKGLSAIFGKIGDIERIGSRIACERANARDLIALKNFLAFAPEIKKLLENCTAPLLRECYNGIKDFSCPVSRIEKTLVSEPPLALTEGGIIRQGFSSELDEIRHLCQGAKKYIAELQEQERKKTGIPNLRVGYNSVFGYYIEVTRSYLNLVPKHYLRKQTVTNGERFITPELKEYEAKVLNAEERIKLLEYEIFLALRREIAQKVKEILEFSDIIAQLDVLLSLALVAKENNYIKPVVDNGSEIIIKGSRHPVVERLIPEPFIENDVWLNNEDCQILLITGPNMAGKSTYLRQVALIVIMAQMGSFIPAQEARIGIVDKIFTRIGASDDLTRGVSTFLAEMNETANILNNATAKSLVILDEVGRGTATYDGLALAWAVVEYLHQNPALKPKTLFATHYHELTALATFLPGVKNYNFAVKEDCDRIIFLRKLREGKSSKSYGIAVAKLAGLPQAVIERAKTILAEFEKGEAFWLTHIPDHSLTTNCQTERKESKSLALPDSVEAILEELRKVDLDKLTPLEALNFLASLQEKVKAVAS